MSSTSSNKLSNKFPKPRGSAYKDALFFLQNPLFCEVFDDKMMKM